MEMFRGYMVRSQRVRVGECAYELLMPVDCDALLDDPRVAVRFAHDEYMPYWATLWPAARLLAEEVARWPVVGTEPSAPTVLELGCGLGLVGLVVARLGYRVTITDYDADAVAFAAESARRSGLSPPTVACIDWRRVYDDLRFDRILAADVLYEARHLRPVAQFMQRHLAPSGFALVADADRSTADPFADVARGVGLAVQVAPLEWPASGPGPRAHGRIFALRCAESR